MLFSLKRNTRRYNRFAHTAMSNSWDTVVGELSLFTFVVGVVGNTLLLVYFLSSRSWRHRLSDTLYLLICLVDLVIMLFHLPASLSLLAGRRPGPLFGSVWFCDVWGVVWNTAVRLSIFLIALLSCSRTLILLRPFRRVSRRVVLGLAGTYLLFQLLLASLPWWFNKHYIYNSSTVVCGWGAEALVPFPSTSYTLYFLWRSVLEFLLPLLAIFPCCLLSIYSLYKGCRAASGCPDHKNSATVTIILLTLAYLAFNAPLAVVVTLNLYSIATYSPPGVFHDFFSWDPSFYTFIFCTVSSVVLNAATNPILFFCRVRAVRDWVRVRAPCREGRRESGIPMVSMIQLATPQLALHVTP